MFINTSIKTFTAILFAIILMAGCDTLEFEEDDKTFGGADYVNFDNASLSVSEADSIGLSVQLNRSKADSSLSVTLSVESEFVQSGDDASDQFSVNPSNLEVSFEEGEFLTTFLIIPVDNDLVDGEKIVTVTIESISSDDYVIGFPGPDQLNSSSTITIIDDDCPIDFEGWEGRYSVEEVFTAGTNEGLSLATAFEETYELTLSQDDSDPTGFSYLVNNVDSADQYLPDDTVIVFNSCGGSVQFPEELNIADFADMNVEETVFNETDFTITANGPLGNFGPYEFILSKIE